MGAYRPSPEVQARRTKAIALNTVTTENMTAYCRAIRNLWDANSSPTSQAAVPVR